MSGRCKRRKSGKPTAQEPAPREIVSSEPAVQASRLARLPVALGCLVFSWLPLQDNRRLTRCASFLRGIGRLPTASPVAVEWRTRGKGISGNAAKAVARVAHALRPIRLSLRTLGRDNIVPMDAVARIAGLRSLSIECNVLTGSDSLSTLTALTDLTLRVDTADGLDLDAARCTSLRRLHMLHMCPNRGLASLATLTRLESLTLEVLAVGGGMWAPLAGLSRLSELGLLCAPGWPTIDLPVFPTDVSARLRRLALRGELSFAGSSLPTATLPHLRSLDLARNAIHHLLFARDMAQIERLVLSGTGVPLEHLSIDNLGRLDDLAKLRTLVLRNAAVRDLGGIEKLLALNELELSGCAILASVAGVSGCKSLCTLGLHDCRQLVDIRPLDSVGQLTALSVRDCFLLHFPDELDATVAVVNSLSGLGSLRLHEEFNVPALAPRLRRLAFGTDCCSLV